MEELTPENKDLIRKVAPNLANALFDEDNKENKDFISELEITHAIRKVSFQETHDNYLPINIVARAIKEGIGEDLLPLIKCLCKLCSKTKSRGKK